MTLVRRHSPTMLRVARGYVAPELAEDVVQETWVAVLRGIDGFSHVPVQDLADANPGQCGLFAASQGTTHGVATGSRPGAQQFALTGAQLGVGRRSTVVVGSRAR
jgi:hypothetical protein